MKFFGECNDVDRAMRQCLKKEVSIVFYFCTDKHIRHPNTSEIRWTWLTRVGDIYYYYCFLHRDWRSGRRASSTLKRWGGSWKKGRRRSSEDWNAALSLELSRVGQDAVTQVCCSCFHIVVRGLKATRVSFSSSTKNKNVSGFLAPWIWINMTSIHFAWIMLLAIIIHFSVVATIRRLYVRSSGWWLQKPFICCSYRTSREYFRSEAIYESSQEWMLKKKKKK